MFDPYARASIFLVHVILEIERFQLNQEQPTARDAWMIGYTPSISVGAVDGNNNKPMVPTSYSLVLIGPMWKGIYGLCTYKVPPSLFEACRIFQTVQNRSARRMERSTKKWSSSELYWLNRNDIQGCPGYNSRVLFNLFENGVLNWASGQGSSLINSTNSIQETVLVLISHLQEMDLP